MTPAQRKDRLRALRAIRNRDIDAWMRNDKLRKEELELIAKPLESPGVLSARVLAYAAKQGARR